MLREGPAARRTEKHWTEENSDSSVWQQPPRVTRVHFHPQPSQLHTGNVETQRIYGALWTFHDRVDSCCLDGLSEVFHARITPEQCRQHVLCLDETRTIHQQPIHTERG